MTFNALYRIEVPGKVARLAVGSVQAGPERFLRENLRLGDLLSKESRLELEEHLSKDPVPQGARVLAPVDTQEVWAAGVTYLRSRDARIQESQYSMVYDSVYEAERPELFLKGIPGESRGPGESIGIRADSEWNVPEAELAVVINSHGMIVGYTLGNDMSSRSIEGENPLYLPQAKVYDKSLALGPCIVLAETLGPLSAVELSVSVEQVDSTVVDHVRLTELKRAPEVLVEWLMRARSMPFGAVLLTGTGMIPDEDFTLRAGDIITISSPSLGELSNPVVEIGERRAVA